MNKHFTKKLLVSVLQVMIIFVTIFGSLVTFEYLQQKNDKKEQMSQVSLYHNKVDGGFTRVLGETNASGEELKGNRFVAQDVTFGGETLMAMTDDGKEEEIEISQLQGKLYRSSEDGNMNYYASWQSNKPTMSVVEYKNEQDAETLEIKENNFGYVHAITLPGVSLASVYQYIIKSKDRWGNEVDSGQFIFYTGAPDASFFQILDESFQDVFGWMMK